VVDENGVASSGTAVIEVGRGPMEGSFNVAVAEFATTGSDDVTTARTLSASVHDQVQTTLQDSSAVGLEVADPASLGAIEGDTAAERAEQARQLAEQVNAHVVLYGTLHLGDGVASLTPEMYLSPSGLTEAGELSGAYGLGNLERGTTDPIALTIAATEFLEPKVAALAPLFVGLAHYQLNDHATAEALFLEAEEGWPAAAAVSREGNGREGVLNLLGNVTGLQKRLDEARAFYTEALSIEPDFARSRFGMAEVHFQQARGPRCADTDMSEDIPQLEDAIRQFREVAELEAPPLSFLPTRARLEVGRILMCMARYGLNTLGEARVEIETVIAENATNDRLRDVVAEAHSMLAVRHVLRSEPEAAIEEFRRAIELTLNDAKTAFYHSLIGDLLRCELKEAERADREYEIAASLVDPPPPREDCDGSG
jgi:tetratricopeptide (TPR) repeat protein